MSNKKCTCGKSVTGYCSPDQDGCVMYSRLDGEEKYPIGGDIKQKIFNILLNHTYANRTKAADELTELFALEAKPAGAVWVKASERLPMHMAFWNIEDGFKKDCSFPVKIDGTVYGMADLYDNRNEGAPDPIYYFVVKGDAEKEYYEDEFHRIEWLDESGTASSKDVDFDFISEVVMDFALLYKKEKYTDLANDSTEFIIDKIKQHGLKIK